MKVSGFTFIRNAVQNDYAIVEAITSILPICDEFIVAAGNSTDNTNQLIANINSPKIKIINTTWDEQLREGGKVFAEETNKAFNAISPDADWAFYIQGDECVHEKYLPLIRQEMETCLTDKRIEGLLFKYLHFYGSYDYFADSRNWYRREIRVVRNDKRIHSYRDAQGFRIDGRKLNVKLIDAYIYHYGWVKPPHGLVNKIRNFNQYYDKNAIYEPPVATATFDYGNAGMIKPFTGGHPGVMLERIRSTNWKFTTDIAKMSSYSLRKKILNKIYQYTGIRIGEYKNYRLLKLKLNNPVSFYNDQYPS
ncbi:glycosyltransferase family 2 protein (plasmid) [Pedobacter sp. BS3]|uniref:glycosyltransferase family 2 protein n=1 Tax=Pedobacter sp. BS3 TaxID=2567937 RepID=UPI0011ECA881|nr:glycosyltransferase family 2 protein [Pedobacter sp. BS3]TZF86019.1 glycosyltransferase family 2 protein [Pedobacter sp. BS3]